MKAFVRFLVLTVLICSFSLNNDKSFAAKTSHEASRRTWELCEAAWAGEIEKIKTLIAEGADVNSKDLEGDTPLHLAVMRNRSDVARLLIANGADLNAKIEAPDPEFSMRSSTASTPLQIAAFEGYLETIELLVTK